MKHFIYLLLFGSLSLLSTCSTKQEKRMIMTVNGPIDTQAMGNTLIHEHILVDFIGADSTGKHRWDMAQVTEVVTPYLNEVKKQGVNTFIDCSPAYLGRDPALLQHLSEKTALNIITNTGYYGAADNKFLPQHAYTESAEQLANRWIKECKEGIENTGIKPGFIKMGVAPEILSNLHRKLITAAGMTHLQTGLTIASHTVLAVPAFEQIAVLEDLGVHPSAFIWVHAQGEKDKHTYIEAAQKGAWVSLDGLNENNSKDYVSMLTFMKQADLLHKVLLSHDAGWYTPGKERGGDFRGYTALFGKLIPLLKEEGFTNNEITQLVVKNPSQAFSISVRKP